MLSIDKPLQVAKLIPLAVLPFMTFCLKADDLRSPVAENDRHGDKAAIQGIPEGVNVRIIPLAKPLKSADGYAQWMYPEQYTAQDILEMIEGLRPQVLERYITGKQNMSAPFRSAKAIPHDRTGVLERFARRRFARMHHHPQVEPDLDFVGTREVFLGDGRELLRTSFESSNSNRKPG